jgi:hypothetical protein
MNNIERTYEVFGLKDMVHKRSAHVVNFFYEVRIQLEGTAVIMDPINAFVALLAGSHSGKDMHFMSFSIKGSCQLGHVNADATDSDRMKRFLTQDRYTHNWLASDSFEILAKIDFTNRLPEPWVVSTLWASIRGNRYQGSQASIEKALFSLYPNSFGTGFARSKRVSRKSKNTSPTFPQWAALVPK